MDALLFVATLVAALGTGLAAGVFFAFSSFVMPALGRLPAAEGAAAMQSINVEAVTPAFMLALFGTGLIALLLAVEAAIGLDRPGAAYRLAGGVTYVVGALGVTAVCNVPRNNALAAADPASPAGAQLWARYLTGWTAWNHVRTIASLAAAALLTLALTVSWLPY